MSSRSEKVAWFPALKTKLHNSKEERKQTRPIIMMDGLVDKAGLAFTDVLEQGQDVSVCYRRLLVLDLKGNLGYYEWNIFRR